MTPLTHLSVIILNPTHRIICRNVSSAMSVMLIGSLSSFRLSAIPELNIARNTSLRDINMPRCARTIPPPSSGEPTWNVTSVANSFSSMYRSDSRRLLDVDVSLLLMAVSYFKRDTGFNCNLCMPYQFNSLSRIIVIYCRSPAKSLDTICIGAEQEPLLMQESGRQTSGDRSLGVPPTSERGWLKERQGLLEERMQKASWCHFVWLWFQSIYP